MELIKLIWVEIPLGKAGLTADDTPKRTNDVSTFSVKENSDY